MRIINHEWIRIDTMGRILAIDYGRKRCGLAVTDILQIAANGLPTIETHKLPEWLKEYCRKESVEEVIVGYPRTLTGEDSESMRYIKPFMGKLPSIIPGIKVSMFDERFTSTIAHQAMLDGGVKKMSRREKGLADKTAAIIILTDYLQSKSFR
jgi:putative Holliday junction resolvase